MNARTGKRLIMQFILLLIMHLLQNANKEEFVKCVQVIEKSNIPAITKSNLIESRRKVRI